MALLFCMWTARAQDNGSVGVYGAYGLNTHRADFRSFPGVPSCCPSYQSGSGSGLSFAALGRMPLASNLRVEVRLGYTMLDGTLTRQESTTVSGNVPGMFEHTVDATLRAFTLEPMLAYNLVGDLHVVAGGRLGLLATSTFDQREDLVQPETGTFPNGSRTQNEVVDAEIPDASSFQGAILVGLQWDLPVNSSKTVRLVPEVTYVYGLTSIVQDLSWHVDQLRFGASIVWTLPSGEDVPVLIDTTPVRQVDTVPIARKAVITSSITASGVDPGGSESTSFVVDVEEFASTQMTPLLGYVFFDEGRSTMPLRYQRLAPSQTASFREEAVNSPDKLSTYHHVLNILGSRMRRSPETTITLVGCNANVGAEAENIALSAARAEDVQRYLVDVWGLAASRIRLQQRNLPEKASTSTSADAQQENRRVEIVAEDRSLLAPVISRDTVRSISPPSIRLRPSVTSERPIARWSIVLQQGQTVLKTFEGGGDVPMQIDWVVQEDRSSQPRTDLPVTYVLRAVDVDSNRTEASGALDTKLLTVARKRSGRIADKEYDKFSLILFDIRSTELGASNKSIIELIMPYVKPASQISITGLSDRLGDATLNQTLAEQRARVVAKALGVAQTATVRGIGNAMTYDPDLPEGRLYTRTVEIVIETPTAP